MSDEELIAACQLRPWEKRLEKVGCIAPLALSIIVGYELIRWGWFTSIGGTIVFVVIATYSGFLLLTGLRDFRTRLHFAELERRYGGSPLAYYITQAQARLITPNAPDWILLLQSSGLPHGKRSFIEVQLWTAVDHPSSLLRCVGTPLWRFGETKPTFEKSEIEIPASERDALISLCSELALEDMADVLSTVMDSFPCTMVAIRKHPDGIGQGKCNLAGILPADEEKPAPRLAALLWETAHAVPLDQSLIGLRDFYRNVPIEEI